MRCADRPPHWHEGYIYCGCGKCPDDAGEKWTYHRRRERIHLGPKSTEIIVHLHRNYQAGLRDKLDVVLKISRHRCPEKDKCGNVAVADASVALRALFHKEGIRVNTLVWDEEYAQQKLAELLQLAKQNGIEFKPTGNCFVDIASLAKIFTAKKIEYNVKIVNGKKMKDAWGPLKGYDDYLLFLSKNM